MTEDEHIKLVGVGDSFWAKLGELAADHIAQMPKEIEDEVIAYLQDRCSIYSTCYDADLPSARKTHGTG
jgi:hypothetical protein